MTTVEQIDMVRDKVGSILETNVTYLIYLGGLHIRRHASPFGGPDLLCKYVMKGETCVH